MLEAIAYQLLDTVTQTNEIRINLNDSKQVHKGQHLSVFVGHTFGEIEATDTSLCLDP